MPTKRLPLIGGVAGAGLGGLVNYLATRRDTDDLPWYERVVPGAIAGAGLGSLGGVIVREFHRTPYGGPRLGPDRPEVTDEDITEMAATEKQRRITPRQAGDPEYLERAIPDAEAYREEHPDIPFGQSLRDEAWGTGFPVAVRDLPEGLGGYYARIPLPNRAMRPSIRLDRDTIDQQGPEVGRGILQHELTHAQQGRMPISWWMDSDSDAHLAFHASHLPPEYASRLHEIEAHLVPIKRRYFDETGEFIDSPQAAREALDWFRGQHDPSDLENDMILRYLSPAFLPDTSRGTDPRRRYFERMFQRWAPGVVRRGQGRRDFAFL